jgi:ABC-2 type transport system ATP-binding protein
MDSTVVTVDRLVKRYGTATAVDDLSFTVEKGMIFALLGPNGAGKTSTLECIEGVRRADAGRIEVLGLDPMRESRRMMRDIGIQLQSQALPATMTVRESLMFFARYRGQTPDFELGERLGLGALHDKQYGQLSTGQQRRLSLALCVQHRPRLVVLDEPTAGLDVQTRDELHRIIEELRKTGVTILLASHDMAEVEKLADRVAVVVAGKLAATGTPREITAAGNSATRLTISTEQGKVLQLRPIFPGANWVEGDGGYARYATHRPAETLKALIAWIESEEDQIVDLRVERPTLEERFLEIVGGRN